jgi:hypothetical protein
MKEKIAPSPLVLATTEQASLLTNLSLPSSACNSVVFLPSTVGFDVTSNEGSPACAVIRSTGSSFALLLLGS